MEIEERTKHLVWGSWALLGSLFPCALTVISNKNILGFKISENNFVLIHSYPLPG